jgi:hypothetical protein
LARRLTFPLGAAVCYWLLRKGRFGAALEGRLAGMLPRLGESLPPIFLGLVALWAFPAPLGALWAFLASLAALLALFVGLRRLALKSDTPAARAAFWMASNLTSSSGGSEGMAVR